MKKYVPGQLFFTVTNKIVDFYYLNNHKSKVYKLMPGTPVVVCENNNVFESKIGDKTIPLEVDLNVWIPVFCMGLVGWIYCEDIKRVF